KIAVGLARIPGDFDLLPFWAPMEQRGFAKNLPTARGRCVGKIFLKGRRPALQDGDPAQDGKKTTPYPTQRESPLVKGYPHDPPRCWRCRATAPSSAPRPSNIQGAGSGTTAKPSISACPSNTSIRTKFALAKFTGRPAASRAQLRSKAVPPPEPS